MIKHLGISLIAVLPVSATAGTWAEFVSHCLDPYEVFAVPVVGFPQMELADRPETFSEDAVFYGPSGTGSIMVTDPLPPEGARACAMMGAAADADDFGDWRKAQIEAGRYLQERSGALLSTDWIEPKIRLHSEIADSIAVYRIVETYLES